MSTFPEFDPIDPIPPTGAPSFDVPESPPLVGQGSPWRPANGENRDRILDWWRSWFTNVLFPWAAAWSTYWGTQWASIAATLNAWLGNASEYIEEHAVNGHSWWHTTDDLAVSGSANVTLAPDPVRPFLIGDLVSDDSAATRYGRITAIIDAALVTVLTLGSLQGPPGSNTLPVDTAVADLISAPSLTQAALDARAVEVVKRGGRCHIVVALGQSNNQSSDVTYATGVSVPRVARFTPTGGIVTESASYTCLTDFFTREFAETLPAAEWVLQVPAAVGDTAFSVRTAMVDGVSVTCSWEVGNTAVAVNLYDRAVSWVAQAIAAVDALGVDWILRVATFSGFESDTSQLDQAEFTAKMLALIEAFRTEFSVPELPFLIGSMVPEYADARQNIHTADVAAALALLPENPALSFASFFYGPRGYANPGQLIHYSAAGQAVRGKLAMAALLRAYQNRKTLLPLPVPNLKISRNQYDKVVATWDPPNCPVSSLEVAFSFDSGATWVAGNIDPDSRLSAVSGAMPWEPVQARVVTRNTAASITTSYTAYSATLPPIVDVPTSMYALESIVGWAGPTDIIPAWVNKACTILTFYTLPASGGAVSVVARSADSTRQLALTADQVGATDLVTATTSSGAHPVSFAAPKAAPGPHIVTASLSADGVTLITKRDSNTSITSTFTTGAFTFDTLRLNISGGGVLKGAYIMFGIALNPRQMAAAQRALAYRYGLDFVPTY